MKLPDKFTIPEDRIPKPFAQGVYRTCVAISITKILEVYNYILTGKYIELSKGYTYARHNRPDKTQGGMDYTHTLNSLLERGSVPAEMYTDYDEMPDIRDRLFASERFDELEEVAKKTKIKDWKKISGDIYMFDNIKKYLYEYQVPLLGNMTTKTPHCVVIVGYDGDSIIYQDHDKAGRIRTVSQRKFNSAYYIDGGVKMPEMKFTDVEQDRWSYKYIKYAFDKGIAKGVSEDKFEPTKPLTREEAMALIYRILEQKGG